MALGKIGVIFCGGKFRGAFGAGFSKALWEKAKPDYIQGVSVGALNGAKLIESGPDALKKIWLGEVEVIGPSCLFHKTDMVTRLFKSSLFTDSGLNWLLSKLDLSKVVNSATHFEIVTRKRSENCLEIFSNREISQEKLLKVIKASVSVGGFFPKVEIDGDYYSDGYYFSLESAAKFGCDTIFVVINDQVYDGTDVQDLHWMREIFSDFNFLLDELIGAKITSFLEHHKDFQLFEAETPWPVYKKVFEGLKAFLTNIVSGDNLDMVSHRLVIISPKIYIPTLSDNGFKKGDLTQLFEHGEECGRYILKKLGL